MNAATLSIGDELLCGEIVDTNAAFLAERLYGVGLPVRQHLTVRDRESDIADALLLLGREHDAVIVTGGLGPTRDDVTARAAARAFGRRLVLNPHALEHLNAFCAHQSLPLSTANERQALLPARIELIPNRTGSACGFYLQHDNCTFFFLPGVPAEMTSMFAETILPKLQKMQGTTTFYATKTLKVFGFSEAQLETLLGDIDNPAHGLALAFCVNFPEIQVKLRTEAPTETRGNALLSEGEERIRAKLGDAVFAEDTETMQSVVARLFRQTGATVSLAESCTGGLLAKYITDIAGSSFYFHAGFVTYDNEAKIRHLNVPATLLAAKGAVSAEVATALAEGCRRTTGSDLALAITGIAGPAGGTDEKPVGTVFIALATDSDTVVRNYRFSGDRERIRTMTAFMALDWLRRYLLKRRMPVAE